MLSIKPCLRPAAPSMFSLLAQHRGNVQRRHRVPPSIVRATTEKETEEPSEAVDEKPEVEVEEEKKAVEATAAETEQQTSDEEEAEDYGNDDGQQSDSVRIFELEKVVEWLMQEHFALHKQHKQLSKEVYSLSVAWGNISAENARRLAMDLENSTLNQAIPDSFDEVKEQAKALESRLAVLREYMEKNKESAEGAAAAGAEREMNSNGASPTEATEEATKQEGEVEKETAEATA